MNRLPLLLVLLVAVLVIPGLLSCGPRPRRDADPPPEDFLAAPSLPQDVGWRSVTRKTTPGGEEDIAIVFVARGEKWYLQRRVPGGRDVVFLSDGETVAANIKLEGLPLAGLDPRRKYNAIYERIPEMTYLGTDEVGGRLAWHFVRLRESEDSAGEGDGENGPEGLPGFEQHLWIDVETRLPRRHRVELGSELVDEQFFELPEDFEVTPELFDPQSLEPRFERPAR